MWFNANIVLVINFSSEMLVLCEGMRDLEVMEALSQII